MRLLDIENLTTLNRLLPESVPRDLNVLIVSDANNELAIAYSPNTLRADDRQNVEAILSRPVTWIPHELDDIKTAINVAYGTIRDIDGCVWTSQPPCPQRWDSLQKTDDGTVRKCSSCNKSVHLDLRDAQDKARPELVCVVAQRLEGEKSDAMLEESEPDGNDAE